MVNVLPPGTTWLDMATLGIAVLALLLSYWRFRRESKTGVRVDVALVPGTETVAVILTNTELRTVTVASAALVPSRRETTPEFIRWRDVNHRRSQSGLPISDTALPKTLEPASASYAVVASLALAKNAFHPRVPAAAVCWDTLGRAYWGDVPADVQQAIRRTKRLVHGPDDEDGLPTQVAVDDDAVVRSEDLV
jgi:hypothetical protein